jgi:hypothetical protein
LAAAGTHNLSLKAIMLDRVSISDIPLFSGLGRAQLEQVRQLMRFATYQRGEIVIEEGAPADNLLYIIIDGEVVLTKKGRYPLTSRPLDYEIAVRGRNEIFGWVSVLDGSPSPGRTGSPSVNVGKQGSMNFGKLLSLAVVLRSAFAFYSLLHKTLKAVCDA